MSDRLLQQENFFETTLSQNIDNDDTVVYLDTVPAKPEGYLVISQDDANKKEIIYYTSVGVNYVQLPNSGGRGIGGTTAQSHNSGETATMDGVAEYHNPIVKALANYRNRAELTFSGGTDNISSAAGTVIVSSSVCINESAETLTDIGVSGTNKSGNVSSGGYRYIYAQDDGDNTFSLYVSNNTSEIGKRRLGFAKFAEGTTDTIRYVYNDDEPSPFARGMVVDWTGPTTDVPQGWEYDTASAGRFSICANVTYTYGSTGGSATYDFSHVHTVNSTNTDHTHYYDHKHYDDHVHAGSTGGPAGSDPNTHVMGDGHASGDHEDTASTSHHHNYTTNSKNTQGYTAYTYTLNTTYGYAVQTGTAISNTTHVHTMVSQLSNAQSIMPPFIARTRIVKI